MPAQKQCTMSTSNTRQVCASAAAVQGVDLEHNSCVLCEAHHAVHLGIRCTVGELKHEHLCKGHVLGIGTGVLGMLGISAGVLGIGAGNRRAGA